MPAGKGSTVATKASQLEEVDGKSCTQNRDHSHRFGEFNFNTTKIGKLYLWGKPNHRVEYVIYLSDFQKKKNDEKKNTNSIEWHGIRFRSMMNRNHIYRKVAEKATNVAMKMGRCHGTECAYCLDCYVSSFKRDCDDSRMPTHAQYTDDCWHP